MNSANRMEEIKRLCNQSLERLMEHADSVQIFVNYHDGEADITKSFETGRGNIHARQGHIQEWLTIQNQYQRNWANEQCSTTD